MTFSERLIRKFHGSCEVIILKLSAAHSMSKCHPGISPPPGGGCAATVKTKHVYMRLMAEEGVSEAGKRAEYRWRLANAHTNTKHTSTLLSVI